MSSTQRLVPTEPDTPLLLERSTIPHPNRGEVRLRVRTSPARLSLACLVTAVACTATSVRPLESDPTLSYICIRENPKVLVSDFVDVVRDVLSSRGLRSEVFMGSAPEKCDAVLTYTARRSWDFSPYLSHAEVRLERDGLQIGYAEYRLRGGGGLSMFKWQGTRTKMEPVLEELFAQVGRR